MSGKNMVGDSPNYTLLSQARKATNHAVRFRLQGRIGLAHKHRRIADAFIRVALRHGYPLDGVL